MSENTGAPSASAPTSEAPAASAESVNPVKAAIQAVTTKPVAAPTSESSEDEIMEGEDSDSEVEPLSKAEQKKAEKLWELKVNGKKLSVNEAELVKRAQLAEAAEEKFQRASAIEKQGARLLEMLKDPTQTLKLLRDPSVGADVKAIARMVYEEELREQEKSPEDREKEALQAERDELKRKYEEEMTRREKEEYDNLVRTQERELAEGIKSAIESSGLPRSEYVVTRLTDMMLAAQEAGIDVTPEDIMPTLKKQMKRELASMPVEFLEEYLAEDAVKGLRKNYVKKLKESQKNLAVQSPTAVVESAKSNPLEIKTEEKQRSKDFFKNLGKK